MAENAEKQRIGAAMTAPLIDTASTIVAPLRTAALIAIGGTALGLFSLAEQRHLRPRLAANDNLGVLNPTSISAAVLHCALGACAYPIGYLIRALAP